jgi:hypothetical protein
MVIFNHHSDFHFKIFLRFVSSLLTLITLIGTSAAGRVFFDHCTAVAGITISTLKMSAQSPIGGQVQEEGVHCLLQRDQS